jgi:hypothetical protein
MIRNRIHHWTCSKFADFIRGEKKPYALEINKWEEWEKEQKNKRPLRFWLSDTFLRHLQNFVYFPIDLYSSIKSYIRNRFFDKIHYLKTGLTPGVWYDFDHRLLHGIFNELVDFVEIELAHLGKWDETKKYNFKKGRCIEASYDYFKWASELKENGELTSQAQAAIKIKKIYEWWKYERPSKIDFFDSIEEEMKQEEEDTQMLIEIINLRKHLWT